MDTNEITEEFNASDAILSGHFILSSGLHSPTYLQCARVMMDAARGERLCAELATRVFKQFDNIDVVVAPAMGGVIVGYEMGRQTKRPTMFCERVDGKFTLRRGFDLEKDQRVLIVEDVVTTGKSSMEAIACVKEYDAVPVGVCSLIDRRSQNDTTLTLPLVSLLTLDIPTYKEDELPEELNAIPAVKPGSRFLNKKAS